LTPSDLKPECEHRQGSESIGATPAERQMCALVGLADGVCKVSTTLSG